MEKNYNPPVSEYDTDISLNELTAAVKMSKNKTSPGLDKISYEILKHLPIFVLNILLQIFNNLWKTGGFITDWNKALVKPLKKPAAPGSNLDSYRPIALTSTICKIYERIVTNRLLHFLDEKQCLTKFQAGFRKARSTMDQLMRLQDDAQRALKHRNTVRAIFLDMSKAFDTVWIPGLLHKIRKLKIPKNIYLFIKKFLSERKIIMEVNETRSQEYNLHGGTPQGSVISPLLFLLMINDFPEPKERGTKYSLFADDSAIWMYGKSYKLITRKLQSYLEEIVDWCNKWGFCLNTKKTQSITFSYKKHNKINFNIKKQTIEEAGIIKFLGIKFDSRLTWSPHISQIIEKIKPRMNLLRSLTGTKYGSNKKTLLMIYKALIRSVFDYACPLFIGASAAQLKRLDKIQNRALQIVCGALAGTPKIALQNECGEMPLWLRRQWILEKYMAKIKQNPENPANDVLILDTPYGLQHKKLTTDYITELLPMLDNIHQDSGRNPYPWDTDFYYIDTTLSSMVNRSTDDPQNSRQQALRYQEIYENRFPVYTDGSGGARIGAGIYIPDTDTKYGARLPDHSNNYIAEATAVHMALQYIQKK